MHQKMVRMQQKLFSVCASLSILRCFEMTASPWSKRDPLGPQCPQCDSGSLERMRRRRERLFLVDGIVTRIPVPPNMNFYQFKASWTGQRWCLLEGIVRRMPETHNITLALLKMCCQRWFLGGSAPAACAAGLFQYLLKLYRMTKHIKLIPGLVTKQKAKLIWSLRRFIILLRIIFLQDPRGEGKLSLHIEDQNKELTNM